MGMCSLRVWEARNLITRCGREVHFGSQPRDYLPAFWPLRASLVAQTVESACNAEDLGPIPGSGRSPREGNGNPLQYSCLGNPMDGEAWWATVHGVAKCWKQLSNTFGP